MLDKNSWLELLAHYYNAQKYEDIINIIEENSLITMDNEFKELLAWALQNTDDPNWQRAHRLLMECKADRESVPNWNFRIGYNYFFGNDRIVLALKHFKRELAVNPNGLCRETVIELIRECEQRLNCGIHDWPFNKRGKAFWTSFLEFESLLLSILDADTGDNAVYCLVDVIAQIMDKHQLAFVFEINRSAKTEIIFTFEGEMAEYIKLKQLIELAPAQVYEHWALTLGRPAVAVKGIFKMDGVEISCSDTQLAYKFEDAGLHLQIANQALYKLYLEDRSKALNSVYVYSDFIFGEVFVLKYVRNITITDVPKGTEANYRPIDVQKRAIYQLFSYEEPSCERFYHYQLEPTSCLLSPRGDVYTGVTRIESIVMEYTTGDSGTFDKAFEEGITYATVFYKSINVPRYYQEHLYRCIQKGVGETAEIIGSATGLQYTYIDFVIFDSAVFVERIESILGENKVKDARYHVLRKGANVFKLTSENVQNVRLN